MSTPVRVLIVEDSPDDTLLLVRELKRGGFEPSYERVETPQAMAAAMDRQAWDIVISDYRLPRFCGLEALGMVKARDLGLPLIVVSGTIGEELAVEAMRAGAQDYVMKDNLARLAQAVERELGAAEMRREAKRVEQALHRREAILDAVRFAADQFLRGDVWEKGVPAVLARLGQASETSRVCIFENHPGPSGEVLAGQRFEWTASDVQPRIDNLEQKAIHLRQAGFGRWEEVLSAGEILHGPLGQFPACEHDILSRQGIRSLAGVPVFVGQAWWGFLRFDDCADEREWQPSELDALRAAAGMLGASIHRKMAEEALRESHHRLEIALAELERSQREVVERERLAAVGQLAAGIAHDFNNTLAVILLYSEMLLQESDQAKAKERAETILSQAQRAAALTQQILDFSRRTVLSRQPMRLVPLLKEFVKMLSRTLPESIDLSATFGPVDYVINADVGRMQQVFMNLALNARDAMPKGGQLQIKVDSLSLRPGEPPPYRDMAPRDWVRIRVSDTGTGIDDQDLPHIFEPFFTTKTGGTGTGLGLAQVYGIVKQHDGYIDVDSRLGAGTTFIIYLPQESLPTTAQAGPSARDDFKGHGETILVVEDTVDARKALCEVLQGANYTTLEASDGMEALEILRSPPRTIDLVVSDMVMPTLGGLELYRLIREEHLVVKVILMTGYPLGEKTGTLLQVGKADWLQKPFSVDTLLLKVGTLLARGDSAYQKRADPQAPTQ